MDGAAEDRHWAERAGTLGDEVGRGSPLRSARAEGALSGGPRDALRLHERADRRHLASRICAAPQPLSRLRVGEEDTVLVQLEPATSNQQPATRNQQPPC